jgi:hypothetical protein
MWFRDEIRIDPAYRASLTGLGLQRVAEVLARVAGRVAAWSRTTDTLHVPGLDGQPGMYVKRYFYPTWNKRIRGTFRGTFFGYHRGRAEFCALQQMRELGVQTVRPVAFGAARLAHFVTACFLITEEVPQGCNLTTFARRVADGLVTLSPWQRQVMSSRLGTQIAHLHGLGLSHGQLFWRNIIVRPAPDGAYEFFLLDAQPLRRWQRLRSGLRWWQLELAHLYVSAESFTTRTDRFRFLRAYFGVQRLTPELKAVVRGLPELACRWRNHEQQRIRMNDLFERWNTQLVREQQQVQRGAAHGA